jgi:N-acylneuraminate cytidylyltransferase/CMP-N,N'-diacetyllegionaminic acid synthase
MKRLCTICARGGSKGVKGKNLRPLLGKPLLAWSIEQALATGLFEAVAVSSDSEEILAAARRFGATLAVRRPDEMATDTAPKLPAIRHCLETASALLGTRFDVFADIDATSPLRLPEDIMGAVAALERSGVSNVITGAPARRSPYFNLVERQPDGSVRLAKQPEKPIVRRQDASACFDMNASIYVWWVERFLGEQAVFYPDTQLFEMPEERSVDVDSELDFKLVELLVQQRLSGGEAHV